MGYRSDIVCLVYGTPDVVNAYIAADKLKGDESVFGHYFKNDYEIVESPRHKDTLFVKFKMDYVKWYDGYDDVNAFMCMIAMVDDYEFDNDSDWLAAEFIRIGESSDDVDEFTFGTYEGLLIGEYKWTKSIFQIKQSLSS